MSSKHTIHYDSWLTERLNIKAYIQSSPFEILLLSFKNLFSINRKSITPPRSPNGDQLTVLCQPHRCIYLDASTIYKMNFQVGKKIWFYVMSNWLFFKYKDKQQSNFTYMLSSSRKFRKSSTVVGFGWVNLLVNFSCSFHAGFFGAEGQPSIRAVLPAQRSNYFIMNTDSQQHYLKLFRGLLFLLFKRTIA